MEDLCSVGKLISRVNNNGYLSGQAERLQMLAIKSWKERIASKTEEFCIRLAIDV
jgi:hypothetical protein